MHSAMVRRCGVEATAVKRTHDMDGCLALSCLALSEEGGRGVLTGGEGLPTSRSELGLGRGSRRWWGVSEFENPGLCSLGNAG